MPASGARQTDRQTDDVFISTTHTRNSTIIMIVGVWAHTRAHKNRRLE